jgi:hypothetical protein
VAFRISTSTRPPLFDLTSSRSVLCGLPIQDDTWILPSGWPANRSTLRSLPIGHDLGSCKEEEDLEPSWTIWSRVWTVRSNAGKESLLKRGHGSSVPPQRAPLVDIPLVFGVRSAPTLILNMENDY